MSPPPPPPNNFAIAYSFAVNISRLPTGPLILSFRLGPWSYVSDWAPDPMFPTGPLVLCFRLGPWSYVSDWAPGLMFLCLVAMVNWFSKTAGSTGLYQKYGRRKLFAYKKGSWKIYLLVDKCDHLAKSI